VILGVGRAGRGHGVFITRGVAAGQAWLLVSQAALQIGYLGGIYLRSVLERVGIVVTAQSGRQL